VPFGSFPEPPDIIARAVTFVLAITVHEFMHAWSALMLGDTTAQREGRVTLNPVKHFDPLGFLFALLLVFGLFGIAWGRPVPVNPYRLWGGRRGMALVAAAGPLSNLVLAVVMPVLILAVFGVFGLSDGNADANPALLDIRNSLVQAMILWNVALFAFNLIPIPPLDGFNILVGLVPSYWVPKLERVRQYALIILLLVMFLPLPNGQPILGALLRPVQVAVLSLILPLIQALSQFVT
jgi:Zn-dependent protease